MRPGPLDTVRIDMRFKEIGYFNAKDDNAKQLYIYNKRSTEKDLKTNYPLYTISNFRFFIDLFILAALSPKTKKITRTYINYVFIVTKFLLFLITNYNKMQKNNGNNNIIIDIFSCFFINFMNFLSILLRGLCLDENIATNILNSTSPSLILYSTIETNTTNAYKKFSEKQLTARTHLTIDIINTGLINHNDVVDYSSITKSLYNFVDKMDGTGKIMTGTDIDNIFLSELAKSVRQSISKKIQDTFYYLSALVSYLNNYHDKFKDDKIIKYKIIEPKESDMKITAYIHIFNALYYSVHASYISIYELFFTPDDIKDIFTIKRTQEATVYYDPPTVDIPKKAQETINNLSKVYADEKKAKDNIISNLTATGFYTNYKKSLDKINASDFADIYKGFEYKNDCVEQLFKSAKKTNLFLGQCVGGYQLSPFHQYNISNEITDVKQEFKYNTYKLEVITNNKNIFVIEKKYTPKITYQLLLVQSKFKEFIKNTLLSLEFKYIIYMMVNMAFTYFKDGSAFWIEKVWTRCARTDEPVYKHETRCGPPIYRGGSIKNVDFTNDKYNPNITGKIKALQNMGHLKGNPYICLILPKITDDIQILITDKNKKTLTLTYELNNEKLSKVIRTANAKAILKLQLILTSTTQESTSDLRVNNSRHILIDTLSEFLVL